MKLLNKGQVGGMQVFVMGIVTVAIVLAIGLIVLSELSTTTKEMATSSILNESVAHGGTLVQSSLLQSVSACRNNTAASTVLTIGTQCNISSAGVVSTTQAGGVYIDYVHYAASAAYNSTNSILTKLTAVPTWIGIIIVVALAFIVLSFFYGKKQ